MKKNSVARMAVAALAVFAFTGIASAADEYPSRPVHLIAPAPAGGASDIYARLLAQKLGVMLNRPFVVENRAGAAGRIGYEAVAKSKPDGYTLIIATSAMLIHKVMYLSLPYDPAKDFAPISLIAKNQQLMVVPASLPANDLKSFIAMVKADPKTHNFSSSGVGNPPHLAAELLCAMAGLEMTHIPNSGDSTALVDVMSGRVSMYLGSVGPAVPLVQAGRIKALAVSGPTRSPALPNVPTMAEAGVPGYSLSGWFGLLAPGGTPQPIVDQLNSAMVKIMAMPDVREAFLTTGLEPGSSSVQEFARAISTGSEAFRETMRIAKIQPEK